MCILWELLFGFLIEPISDLSRVNPCGVYPWLIFYLWKWHHLIPWPVPSDPLLIRITSSGIRASTFDTGSILFDIFFLRILLFLFLLFFIPVVSVPVFVLVFVLVFIFCLFYSISFLCLLAMDGQFVPCYIRILLGTNSACLMNLGFSLIACLPNCLLNEYIGGTSGIVKSAL